MHWLWQNSVQLDVEFRRASSMYAMRVSHGTMQGIPRKSLTHAEASRLTSVMSEKLVEKPTASAQYLKTHGWQTAFSVGTSASVMFRATRGRSSATIGAQRVSPLFFCFDH